MLFSWTRSATTCVSDTASEFATYWYGQPPTCNLPTLVYELHGARPVQARVLTRLNRKTRPYHSDVDASWLALTSAEADEASYVQQLVRVYGFEASLEAAFAYTPGLAVMMSLRDRSRSGLIALDLLSLGSAPHHITAISQCSIAPFAAPAEALGWMYLLQRSTLLHERVKDCLLQRLPHLSSAVSYLSTSSGVAVARWNEFGLILAGVATTDAIADQIAEGAADAFRTASRWFEAVDPDLRRAG